MNGVIVLISKINKDDNAVYGVLVCVTDIERLTKVEKVPRQGALIQVVIGEVQYLKSRQ